MSARRRPPRKLIRPALPAFECRSVCVCVIFVTCEVRVCGLRCRSGSSLYIYRVYSVQSRHLKAARRRPRPGPRARVRDQRPQRGPRRRPHPRRRPPLHLRLSCRPACLRVRRHLQPPHQSVMNDPTLVSSSRQLSPRQARGTTRQIGGFSRHPDAAAPIMRAHMPASYQAMQLSSKRSACTASSTDGALPARI